MGALTLLLPQQVAALVGEDGKVSALGLVTGIAALAAAVAQPVAGYLSDRTRTRLGRRNTWVLGGGIAAAVLIYLVGRTATIPMLILAWSAVQAAGNAVQAGVTAALAERIPVERRASASGVIGLATMLGIVVGPVVARAAGGGEAGYTALAGVVLFSSLIFALTTKDRRAAEPVAAAPGKPAAPRDPQVRRDFWWGFSGRAALFLAYAMVSGYTLYMLQDYVGLSAEDAESKVTLLSGVMGAAVIVVAPLSGLAADKTGRLKPFVMASSALFIPAFAVMYAMPTLTGMVTGMLLVGLAFGSYMAVDQALMTRILPSMDDAGRDLGILNIASAGPQIAAPFVASLIISAMGGYRTLFAAGIVLAVLGTLAIHPIRSVR
ncbi:MFS transporter [Actinocorallia sp. A-T 12471]|uniref:MFS transporter n=1 Tax=Actinocorallia sp. A-T 12471 TaxID=3089813 RepID=UPI0039B6F33B